MSALNLINGIRATLRIARRANPFLLPLSLQGQSLVIAFV